MYLSFADEIVSGAEKYSNVKNKTKDVVLQFVRTLILYTLLGTKYSCFFIGCQYKNI